MTFSNQQYIAQAERLADSRQDENNLQGRNLKMNQQKIVRDSQRILQPAIIDTIRTSRDKGLTWPEVSMKCIEIGFVRQNGEPFSGGHLAHLSINSGVVPRKVNTSAGEAGSFGPPRRRYRKAPASKEVVINRPVSTAPNTTNIVDKIQAVIGLDVLSKEEKAEMITALIK